MKNADFSGGGQMVGQIIKTPYKRNGAVWEASYYAVWIIFLNNNLLLQGWPLELIDEFNIHITDKFIVII